MAKCGGGGGGCSCIVVVKVAALVGREAAAGFFLFPANLRAHQTLVLRCSSASQRVLQREGGVRFLRRKGAFVLYVLVSFFPSFGRPPQLGKTSRQPPPQPPQPPLSLSRASPSARLPPALEIAKRGEGGGSMMMIAVSCFSFLPCTLRLRG